MKNIKSNKLNRKSTIMIAMFLVAIFFSNTSFSESMPGDVNFTVSDNGSHHVITARLSCWWANFFVARTFEPITGDINAAAGSVSVQLISTYRDNGSFISYGHPISTNAYYASTYVAVPAQHPIWNKGQLVSVKAEHIYIDSAGVAAPARYTFMSVDQC